MSIATAARRAPISYRGAKHVALYLINYGARGFYAPFISLYLVSIGYSPVDLGLLAGLSAIVRIVVVPAYSAWVDRLGAHRRLLNVQLAIAGFASLTMVLWPNRTWLDAMYVTRDAVDVPGSALMSRSSSAVIPITARRSSHVCAPWGRWAGRLRRSAQAG
ncbi:MAG: hypothetical protein HND48_12355 [Chloroflexi bacterium]|nr:hypothetical protein [Chloroflexota bacterium]